MKGGAVRRQNAKKMYAVWVNFNLKCLVIYPSTLAMHYKLKDLFDSKGCVMPTLVENNMTNKPMRPKLL